MTAVVTLDVMDSQKPTSPRPIKPNAERLALARNRAGLTQEDLGKRMRPTVRKQQINRMERSGQLIKPTIARQLAEILGGSPDDYVDESFLLHGAGAGAPLALDKGSPITVAPAGLKDVMIPLIRLIGGEDGAQKAAEGDFRIAAANCNAFIAESAKRGDVDLTDHLTLWILTASAGASAARPDRPDADYRRWHEAAKKAAGLLVAISDRPQIGTGRR